MKKMIRIVGLLCLFTVSAHAVDMIIFSYDRPLQLYALLESLQTYVTGISRIQIIYRVSEPSFQEGYSIVRAAFPDAQFVSHKDRTDFKEVLLTCLADTQQEYCLFAVDDIIITDYVDLKLCTAMLAATGAYGFYLRLGKNITHHAMGRRAQQVPQFVACDNDVIAWRFSDGGPEWNYAHTLDMTIYRKRDIAELLETLPYTSPNSLEHHLSLHSKHSMYGICFVHSKVINIPLNQVQTDFDNVTLEYSTHELLAIFKRGLKLDNAQLQGINHTAPHLLYHPTYIPR